MRKKLRLGLFGLPGAGKGTQAERLSKHLALPHISTGDMFRALQESQSPIAVLIKEVLSSGQLVSDDLVTDLTFERLSKPDATFGYILDGFPRTMPQAIALQSSQFALDALIEIRVPRDEIIQRLSGRRVCPSCKAIYHVDSLPVGSSVCPKDQSGLRQRTDDMPEAVMVRLDIFEANFSPLVHYFEEKRLLRTIDGSGEPDEVFGRLLAAVERIVATA